MKLTVLASVMRQSKFSRAQLDAAAIIARRNHSAGVLAGEFGRRPAARTMPRASVLAAGRCGNSPPGRLRYDGGVKLRPIQQMRRIRVRDGNKARMN